MKKRLSSLGKETFLIRKFPLPVQFEGLKSGKGVCERCGNQAIAALIHGQIATTIDAIKL